MDIRSLYISTILVSLNLAVINVNTQVTWQSQIVYFNTQGKLSYQGDSSGNRIPDFSYAGYKNSQQPIPHVPVIRTISPIEGDNTALIQNTLFEMAQFPLDSNGFRGALYLNPGIYEIEGIIRLNYEGIVLRGAGDGEDNSFNTILKATGNIPNKRTVLVAGGGGASRWRDEVPGTRTDIISDSVLVGDRRFRVENISPFMVGDNIIIYHPCTQNWLTVVDSGGTFWFLPGADPYEDFPWAVGEQPIVFNRYITDINGDTITIDAPVFNHLIRVLSQSHIYKYARQGIRTNIGIENLRIDIQTAGGADENHAWNAIDLYQVEDAWVQNCTMLHFGLSAVRTNTATRVTVKNCRALDPVSLIEGERRYNFNVYNASQQILFINCHATNGRHHYVSNGTSWTSGCVFLDCTSSGAFTSSEGHRRWSMGLLYDNLIELDGPRPGYNPRLLGLYNRGYYGTSHGWALAHSVAWACNVAQGDLIVQQPPTAQNYAIGCFGNVTGEKPPAPFDVPQGYIEGTNIPGLEPRSLFLAQLEERVGTIVSIEISDQPILFKANGFEIFQNYPNPFNPITTISFRLYNPAEVEIKIYNSLGAEVTSLGCFRKAAGKHAVRWDGTDRKGQKVASGIYVYQINIKTDRQSFSTSRKMILLR